MNRRRFLELTIAMASAVAVIKAGIPAAQASGDMVNVTMATPWVPTQAEVDEWLEWYKVCTRSRFDQFADVMKDAFQVHEPYTYTPPNYTVAIVGEDCRDPLEESDLFEQAERAFAELGNLRYEVGVAQGAGYEAGRDGHPRWTWNYPGHSTQGYAWYNGWALGNFDYRLRRGEVKLTRSPGVTWPEGKRPLPWNPYVEIERKS